MDTIPFKLHDPDAMFAETAGVVQLYDDRLRLQLETSEWNMHNFSWSKKTTEANIPLREISSASVETGWFKTQLTVQVRDLDSVKDIPGSKLGEIRLRFARRHREAAEQLTTMLDDALYELRLAWDSEDQTPVT